MAHSREGVMGSLWLNCSAVHRNGGECMNGRVEEEAWGASGGFGARRADT